MPESITVIDEYAVHKQAEFTQAMEKINSKIVLVDGGFTAYLNPGDMLINKMCTSTQIDSSSTLRHM